MQKTSLGLFLLLGSLGGLLLLDVLGEEGLVLLGVLLGGLETVSLGLDDRALAADTLLGDKTLDLGGLVESLVSALDLTANNVLADIVLLLVKSEGLNDVVAALHTESVGALDIGHTSDLTVTLLGNAEEDRANIGSDDAATDGLAGTLTNAHGLVASATLLEEDAGSAVDKDTLLHLETLLIVTAGNSEDVALELVTQDFAVNFLTHSSVEEGTDCLFIVNFKLFLATSGWVCNIEFHL